MPSFNINHFSKEGILNHWHWNPFASPVAKQRRQDHERVLHKRHDLGRAVSSKQQLAAVLEVAEREFARVPFGHDLFELGLDVLLFDGRDADVLVFGENENV